MIFRFILFLVIMAIVLRFVMRYIMPIFQVTRMAHRQMTDMKKQMEAMQQKQSSFEQQQNKRAKRIDEDYIDYEEVK